MFYKVFLEFLRFLKESFRDLLPIIAVILFFQIFILKSVPDNWQSTTIGLIIVGIGLTFFLMGLKYGIFPIGKELTEKFAEHKSRFWLIIFGFLVGFGTTIAEPALYVIAEEAQAISQGRIDANLLRYIVAASVGFAIVLGIWRIIKGFPIHYLIIIGYLLVVGVTYFTPHEIVGLAYDLGGVTTSTITVPLVAAIGIGLATITKGRSPLIDGFGIIALASLTPMIFVQVYGIYIYNFGEITEVGKIIKETTVSTFILNADTIITGLFNTIKDVAPIIITIFFFQYIILKEKIPFKELKSILIGIGMVVIGLYAFILGLEMGLFSLGKEMAFQLTQLSNVNIIYLFAFLIGFSTTMAEPTLIAIANKASEVARGKINTLLLRIFVALGVGIGITLGAYRIVEGDFIQNYIIVGYIIVIALTYFAPRYIIPIAYDSGGVTTSTITVPLVAALGIGLATNIPGRDPMLDGFGLIAFASLFPIITVLIYGLLIKVFKIKVRDQYKEDFEHIGPGEETKKF